MLLAATIAAALLTAVPPECGVVGLPNIDTSGYAVVNAMTDSAGATGGRPSTRFFAEPLATALEDEYRRWDRGETPRLARDWLTRGGAMNAVADVSLYSLNRSGVDDMDMQLGFTNAEGEVVYRRLKLRCHDGRWLIDYIFLGDEEGYLNTLLARTP